MMEPKKAPNFRRFGRSEGRRRFVDPAWPNAKESEDEEDVFGHACGHGDRHGAGGSRARCEH